MIVEEFKTRLYVWNIDNIVDEDYEDLYKKVSTDRQAKADRIKNIRDKVRCVAAYYLLEQMYRIINVELFGDGKYELPDICIGEKGKPYLKDSPFYYNLSHSGDRLLLAVSTDEVGCDVEYKKDEKLAIAKRFFAPEEYEYLLDKDDFTGIWTLKESVIKACGAGMSYPMTDFCVIKDSKIVDSLTLSDDAKYYLKRYKKDGQYEYSCCGKNKLFEEDYRSVSYNKKTKELVCEYR